MKIYASTILLAAAALSQMGSTNCGEATRDPGFDLWCGNELCAWKLERGEIRRVPTWNDGDSGVELVGDNVAIAQLSPVNSGDGTCLKFELVADIEDNADVEINVDAQSDGTLELHEHLPGAHWKPLSYNFAIKPPYDGIRFEITKTGIGHAKLAQVQVSTQSGDKCTGLEQHDPGPRRDGAACLMATDCASDLCIASPVYVPSNAALALACATCTPGDTAACGAGKVCGLGEPAMSIFAVPVQCVPQAARELGERCISNAECESNLCATTGGTHGVCSTCSTDTDCTGGLHCARAWPGVQLGDPGPLVCGGGSHLATAGAPCGTDDDCASGRCGGAIRNECFDGRPCSQPSDCPFDPGDLHGSACNVVGIQGGSCQ